VGRCYFLPAPPLFCPPVYRPQALLFRWRTVRSCSKNSSASSRPPCPSPPKVCSISRLTPYVPLASEPVPAPPPTVSHYFPRLQMAPIPFRGDPPPKTLSPRSCACVCALRQPRHWRCSTGRFCLCTVSAQRALRLWREVCHAGSSDSLTTPLVWSIPPPDTSTGVRLAGIFKLPFLKTPLFFVAQAFCRRCPFRRTPTPLCVVYFILRNGFPGFLENLFTAARPPKCAAFHQIEFFAFDLAGLSPTPFCTPSSALTGCCKTCGFLLDPPLCLLWTVSIWCCV